MSSPFKANGKRDWAVGRRIKARRITRLDPFRRACLALTAHLALALALVKRLTKITLRPVLQTTCKRPLQDLRKPAEVVNYDSSNHSTFNMKALIGIARKWSLILKRRFDKLQVHTLFSFIRIYFIRTLRLKFAKF